MGRSSPRRACADPLPGSGAERENRGCGAVSADRARPGPCVPLGRTQAALTSYHESEQAGEMPAQVPQATAAFAACVVYRTDARKQANIVAALAQSPA